MSFGMSGWSVELEVVVEGCAAVMFVVEDLV